MVEVEEIEGGEGTIVGEMDENVLVLEIEIGVVEAGVDGGLEAATGVVEDVADLPTRLDAMCEDGQVQSNAKRLGEQKYDDNKS